MRATNDKAPPTKLQVPKKGEYRQTVVDLVNIVDQMQGQIKSSQARIQVMEANLLHQNEVHNQLIKKVEEYEVQIKTYEQRVADLEAYKTASEESSSTMKTQLSRLESRAKKLKKKAIDYASWKPTVIESIEKHESTINSVNSNLNELDQNLQQVTQNRNTRLTKLEQVLKNSSLQVTSHSSDIESIKQCILDLKAKIPDDYENIKMKVMSLEDLFRSVTEQVVEMDELSSKMTTASKDFEEIKISYGNRLGATESAVKLINERLPNRFVDAEQFESIRLSVIEMNARTGIGEKEAGTEIDAGDFRVLANKVTDLLTRVEKEESNTATKINEFTQHFSSIDHYIEAQKVNDLNAINKINVHIDEIRDQCNEGTTKVATLVKYLEIEQKKHNSASEEIFSKLNEKIQTLETISEETRNKTSENEEAIKEFTSSIEVLSACQKQIKDIQNQVNTVAAKERHIEESLSIGGIMTELEELKQGQADIDDKVTELLDAELSRRVQDISNSSVTLQQNQAEVRAKMAAFEASLAKISSKQSLFDQLGEQLESLKDKETEFEEQMQNLETKVESNETTNIEVKSTFEIIKANSANMEKKCSTLESFMNETNKSILLLQQNHNGDDQPKVSSAVLDKISALEHSLAEISETKTATVEQLQVLQEDLETIIKKGRAEDLEKLNQITTSIEVIKAKVEDMEISYQTYSTQTQNVDKAEQELRDITTALIERVDNHDSLLQDLQEMKSKVEKEQINQDIINEIQNKLSESQANQDIKNVIDQHSNEINDIKSQLQQVQENYQNCQNQTKEQLDQIQNMNHSEEETRKYSQELDEKISQIESTLNEVKNKQINTDDQIKEIGNREAGAQEMTKYVIDSIKDRISSLVENFEQQKEENENQFEVFRGYEQRIENLNSSLAQNEERYGSIESALNNNKSSIVEQIENIQTSLNQNREEQSNANEKISQIELQVNELTNSSKSISEKSDSIEATIGEIKEQLNSSAQLEQLNVHINEVKAGIEASINEIQSRIGATEQYKDQIETLQIRFEEHLKVSSESIAQLQKLNQNGNELTNSSQELIERVNGVETTINSLKDQVNNTEKTDQLYEHIQSLQNKFEDLQNVSNTAITQLQKLDQSKEELAGSSMSILERIAKIESQIPENYEQIQEQLSSIKETIEAHHNESQESVRQLKLLNQSEEDLKQYNIDIQDRVVALEAAATILKSHETDLTERIKEVQNKENYLEETQDTKMSELKEQIQAVQSKVRQFESDNSTVNKQIKNILKSIEDNKDGISTVNDKISRVESNSNENKKFVTKFNAQINEQNKLIEANSSKIEEVNGRFDTTFQKMKDVLESVSKIDAFYIKHKNLKKSIQNQFTEFREYVDKEDKANEDKQKEILESIQVLKDRAERLELQNKVLTKMQSQRPQNEEQHEDQVQIPAELTVDVEQLKLRVEELENGMKDAKENVAPKVAKLEEQVKTNKEDYMGRFSNMEYVSSKEREEFMARLQELDDRAKQAQKELADCPRMITNAIETNQIAINDFREKIDNEISDMKSQLKQASFADDEIEELRIKVFQITDEQSTQFNKINDKLEKTEHDVQRLRSVSEEHTRIWSSIETLNINMDVQNKVIPKMSKTIEKLKKLKVLLPQVTEEGDEDKEETAPETTVEFLKLKLQSLEENIQTDKDAISQLKDRLTDEEERRDALGKKIADDLRIMRNELPNAFVELDTFESLKNELSIVKNATNSTIESSYEERQSLKKELKQMNKRINELAGQMKTEDGEEVAPIVETTKSIDSNELKDMKLMINGIELSAQRQIRKLKRSVRKIERALEDAEEEEKKQIEADKLRQREEEIMQEQQAKVESQTPVLTQEQQQQQPQQTAQQSLAASIVDNNAVEPVASTVSSALAAHAISSPNFLEDDFNVFFVLMFAVLMYFLISDLFIS